MLSGVMPVEDNNVHHIGTETGTLPQLFTRNQFSVCPAPLIATEKSLKSLFVKLQRPYLYVLDKDIKDALAKPNVVQKSATVGQLIFYVTLNVMGVSHD